MTLVTFGETALQFSTASGRRFETSDEVEVHADGTASNVAAIASRLGGDAVWLSKVPDTPLGRRVAAELHEHGLETEIVWTEPETGRQGLTFYEDASPPREDRLLQDRINSAAATLKPGEVDMHRVQNADAVFTDGSTISLSDTAVETAKALLRTTDGISALDLDFHPGLWSAEQARTVLAELFGSVNLLFANEQQAKTVFDRTGKPRELVHSIASSHDLEMVVLTRNERGVVAYYDGVVHEQDAIETEVIDESGQHDALVGAFLEQLLAGNDVDDALAHGVAAAALTRTMVGPVTPIEAAEVDRLVESLSN